MPAHGPKLLHHRTRQSRLQRHKPSPRLPATGAEFMQGGAEIFHNCQDDSDDGGEERGNVLRPWRDDAAVRHAVASRADHMMVPSRGGRVRVFAIEAAARCFFTGEKILRADSGREGSRTFARARTGNYKSNVPGSGCSGHTVSNSDIFQITLWPTMSRDQTDWSVGSRPAAFSSRIHWVAGPRIGPFSRVFEIKPKVCLRGPAESWRNLTYPQAVVKLWTQDIVLRIWQYTIC
jgi:hypothetical protein